MMYIMCGKSDPSNRTNISSGPPLMPSNYISRKKMCMLYAIGFNKLCFSAESRLFKMQSRCLSHCLDSSSKKESSAMLDIWHHDKMEFMYACIGKFYNPYPILPIFCKVM